MGIVVDTDALSLVFEESNSRHNEFNSVLEWIQRGQDRLVYGGSTYKAELEKARKFLGIISELRKARKAKELDTTNVDSQETRLRNTINNRHFDDHHIIAIVIVGRCKYVCSLDQTLHSHLQNKSLYPKHFRRPRIYSSQACANMLRN